MPLTQKKLAAEAGIAERSVARTLAGWIKNDLLKRRGQLILMTNLSNMQARCAEIKAPLVHHSGILGW